MENFILFIQILADAIFGGITEAIGMLFFLVCAVVLFYGVGYIAMFLTQPSARKDAYNKNKYVKKIVDFLVNR